MFNVMASLHTLTFMSQMLISKTGQNKKNIDLVLELIFSFHFDNESSSVENKYLKLHINNIFN